MKDLFKILHGHTSLSTLVDYWPSFSYLAVKIVVRRLKVFIWLPFSTPNLSSKNKARHSIKYISREAWHTPLPWYSLFVLSPRRILLWFEIENPSFFGNEYFVLFFLFYRRYCQVIKTNLNNFNTHYSPLTMSASRHVRLLGLRYILP